MEYTIDSFIPLLILLALIISQLFVRADVNKEIKKEQEFLSLKKSYLQCYTIDGGIVISTFLFPSIDVIYSDGSVKYFAAGEYTKNFVTKRKAIHGESAIWGTRKYTPKKFNSEEKEKFNIITVIQEEPVEILEIYSHSYEDNIFITPYTAQLYLHYKR